LLPRAGRPFFKKEILACLPFLLPLVAHASSIEALSTPALTVRAPARVVLIALANAGPRIVAAGEHGVIIYSDDNGKTWSQASVPVDLTLTSLAFATPQIGWAAGHYGAILHTQDGGQSWRLQLDGNQANQLTETAAVAAQGAPSVSPAVPLAAVRASHFLADGPDKPFLSVLAQNPDQVTVFGAYRMAMHSDDGGKTWSDWSLRVGDRLSHHLYDAAFIGRQICLAGEAGNVFCSSDAGQSFPAVTSPGPATLLGLLPTGDGGMLAYGVAGLADRSADGGQTWSSAALGAQSNITCGRVLESGAILVGGEDGSLYVSADHGRHFHGFGQSVPMAIFDLIQAADGSIILAGSGGILVLPARGAS
jgi:photosystem II stability/assembly factor-like uncharacterized protein